MLLPDGGGAGRREGEVDGGRRPRWVRRSMLIFLGLGAGLTAVNLAISLGTRGGTSGEPAPDDGEADDQSGTSPPLDPGTSPSSFPPWATALVAALGAVVLLGVPLAYFAYRRGAASDRSSQGQIGSGSEAGGRNDFGDQATSGGYHSRPERVVATIPRPSGETPAGIHLALRGGRLLVRSVDPAGQAGRQGLRAGMAVTRICGMSVAGRTPPEVVAIVRGAGGSVTVEAEAPGDLGEWPEVHTGDLEDGRDGMPDRVTLLAGTDLGDGRVEELASENDRLRARVDELQRREAELRTALDETTSRSTGPGQQQRRRRGGQVREELEARYAVGQGRSDDGGADGGGSQAGTAAVGLYSNASPEELSVLVLTIQDEYAKLSKDKATADETIADLNSQYKIATDEIRSQREDSEAAARSYEAAISELRARLQGIQSDVADSSAREEEYKSKIEEIQGEIEDLQNDRAAYESDRKRREAEAAALQAKFENKHEEFVKATDDLERLNSENEEYARRVESYEEERDKLQDGLREAIEQLSVMETKVAVHKIEKEEAAKEHQTRLAQLEIELAEARDGTAEASSATAARGGAVSDPEEMRAGGDDPPPPQPEKGNARIRDAIPAPGTAKIPTAEKSNQHGANKKKTNWLCDVCKVAIFEDYHEALEHEKNCKGPVCKPIGRLPSDGTAEASSAKAARDETVSDPEETRAGVDDPPPRPDPPRPQLAQFGAKKAQGPPFISPRPVGEVEAYRPMARRLPSDGTAEASSATAARVGVVSDLGEMRAGGDAPPPPPVQFGAKEAHDSNPFMPPRPVGDVEAYRLRTGRLPSDRPITKLSMVLIETYKEINKRYYDEVAARQAAWKAGQGPQNDGWDDENYDYILTPNEVIHDGRYQLIKRIGTGLFGPVVKAVDTRSGAEVAIKIIKSRRPFQMQAQMEINLLELLNRNDEDDQHNIVTFLDEFLFRNHQCIVFEMLSLNLYELLKNTQFAGVSLNLIRKFAKQILRALAYMARNDVIHCDLKPENILLRHPKRSGIKVIDFGSSCRSNQRMYSYIQSRFYRSPEVILGLPYGTPIDMWSLGCLLVEMHTGEPLFSGSNSVDQFQKIVAILGMPPMAMIERSDAKIQQQFFEKSGGAGSSWSIKQPPEAGAPPIFPSGDPVASLRDVIVRPSERRRQTDTDERYAQFVDMIHGMLSFEPSLRIAPDTALEHPFILWEPQT